VIVFWRGRPGHSSTPFPVGDAGVGGKPAPRRRDNFARRGGEQPGAPGPAIVLDTPLSLAVPFERQSEAVPSLATREPGGDGGPIADPISRGDLEGLFARHIRTRLAGR
jgi:hypothetical protein